MIRQIRATNGSMTAANRSTNWLISMPMPSGRMICVSRFLVNRLAADRRAAQNDRQHDEGDDGPRFQNLENAYTAGPRGADD